MIKYLATSYFHQDYQLEADSPIGIIDTFIESENAQTSRELLLEISSRFDEGMTEDEARVLWVANSGSSFDPASSGESCLGWLRRVRDLLAERLDEAR